MSGNVVDNPFGKDYNESAENKFIMAVYRLFGVIFLNRAIHAIRTVCIVLAILSLASFIFIYTDHQARAQLSGPDISMDSDSVTISVQDDPSGILAGITATDSSGQDVSELLIVESLGNFIAPSTREAVIAAFDHAGNVAKVVRTVVYSDYTSPKLALSGPLISTVSASSAMLDRITVTDCLDGDITDQMVLSQNGGNVIYTIGEFQILLQASNSAGDTLEVPLTIEYINPAEERTRPVIALTNYLIYVKAGTQVNPEAYLKSLTLDGSEYIYDLVHDVFIRKGNTYQQAMNSVDKDLLIPLSALRISDPAAYGTPGAYEIEYQCTSAAGVPGTVRLVVIVE